MLVIKENDRVYLVESRYEFLEYGHNDHCMVAENVPLFKAKRSNVIIGAVTSGAVDDIRYARLPVPRELNLAELKNTTMPSIKDIWRGMGRDDEDGEFFEIAFAQGNRAFIYRFGDVITEVVDEEAIGIFDMPLRYALKLTRGMPLMDRLQTVYKSVENLSATRLFPLFVIDTVSKKVKMIKESKR